MIKSILDKLTDKLMQRYGEFKALRIIVLLVAIKDMIRDTFRNWIDDDIPLHGAALAFYTIFSLAPLTIVVIAVTGFIFGEQAATGQVEAFLSQLVGPDVALFVENIIAGANTTFGNILATIIGVGTIMFTSTTVITQLKSSLNNIWKVETKSGQSIRQFLISRLTAFVLVLIFAGVLISSLLVDAVLSVIGDELSTLNPDLLVLISWINEIAFIVSTVLLFSIIFKMLPDIKIRWFDAVVGAMVTTGLFMIGRYFVTVYLGMGAIGSTYGTAGTFVLLLIWIYYNSMTIFLGAEFTHQFTIRFGGGVELPKHAKFKKEFLQNQPSSKTKKRKRKEPES